MGKLDEVKESIGLLKAIFIVLIVIDSSLIAWLFNHPSLTLASSVVIGAIMFVTIIDLLIFTNILKKIKSLEDL